jgi:pyruvate ferredoxin oxidoreductase beta subunit
MVTIKEIPEEELIFCGNASCAGCMANLALRHALKALGPNTTLTIPAFCTAVIQGLYPKVSHKVPILNTMFMASASTASGLIAGYEVQKKDTTVLAWAGDGGTYDIGIQALSGAAERNENFIYACYDNNAYSNTGIQRSSATPYGATTTTTPEFNQFVRKDIALIMADHNIPYLATTIASEPRDLIDKFKKAKSIHGMKFILILVPCPLAWRYDMWDGVEIGKLAVKTGAWILWEKEGDKYRFTGLSKLIAEGKLERLPAIEYLKPQGRFKNLLKNPKALKRFEDEIDRAWKNMKARVESN